MFSFVVILAWMPSVTSCGHIGASAVDQVGSPVICSRRWTASARASGPNTDAVAPLGGCPLQAHQRRQRADLGVRVPGSRVGCSTTRAERCVDPHAPGNAASLAPPAIDVGSVWRQLNTAPRRKASAAAPSPSSGMAARIRATKASPTRSARRS